MKPSMPTMSSSHPVADRQRADPERFGCHEGLGGQRQQSDDLTVEFQLTRPNPRFQLDYFSVRIWGSISFPNTSGTARTPESFTYYDPAQGCADFTGPYKLASVSESEFTYVRDDNWWEQSGFQELPQPKKLVWVWYGPEETRLQPWRTTSSIA